MSLITVTVILTCLGTTPHQRWQKQRCYKKVNTRSHLITQSNQQFTYYNKDKRPKHINNNKQLITYNKKRQKYRCLSKRQYRKATKNYIKNSSRRYKYHPNNPQNKTRKAKRAKNTR